MQLIVYEIDENKTIFQEITANKNIDMVAIRPRIYKHLAPAGTIKVQIKDANSKLIAESNSVTITDINAANYSHTYYKFLINASLKSGSIYQIHIVSAGYTFSESAYVGWCATFEFGRTTPSYSPSADFSSPLDFELWERK